MNPLLKGAEQIRYYSPIYEPIYDEEDNVIEEECVRNGTNILKHLSNQYTMMASPGTTDFATQYMPKNTREDGFNGWTIN